MAGSFYSWSKTPTDNQTADGDINWTEGQLPDTVNDSARQMMARSAEFRDDTNGTLTAGGSANAITLTANSSFTTLAQGRMVSFKAASSNTGATTINVNGLGSKAIRKMSPTGDVALTANDIRADGIYNAQYSTAANGAAGAWVLINPTLSSSALNNITSTDNAIARFDGTTGGLQNSGVIIDDSNNVTANSLNLSAAIALVSQTTIDGADNALVALGGGGGFNTNRGALVVVYGNEHATQPGDVRLIPATGVGGEITLEGPTTLSGALTGTSGSFSGTFAATTFSGSGASLTAIPAAQLTGTVASARISGSYTGITGTGALNAGSISSGFGAIDIGASAVSCGNVNSSGIINTGTGTQQVRMTSDGIFARQGATMIFRPGGSAVATAQMTYSTTGVLTVASDVAVSSDVKLKKHIKTITGAIDLVKQLRGVRFTRRKVNTKSIGFIAQEVESVFPELVHENETGKSVSYPFFVALLVEAVKELSAKVERLEGQK